MNVKEEYFYDCEALLKYLYSKTKEEIECETALANEDKAVTKDAIRYRKQLERRCKKARIETLNDNHLASIALFEDVESLCAKVEHGNSTPNAKRVFNMLISDSEKLRVYISDDNNDTPLEKYMKGVLNVTLAPRTKHTYFHSLLASLYETSMPPKVQPPDVDCLREIVNPKLKFTKN